MYKDLFLQQLDDFIKDSDGFGLQGFIEKDYDGGCPCFSGSFYIDGEKCEVSGRCWRVSGNKYYQDLHLKCPKDVGEKIKECLDKQEWYNPYVIIWHNESFLSKR